jgi:hypothetical protein
MEIIAPFAATQFRSYLMWAINQKPFVLQIFQQTLSVFSPVINLVIKLEVSQ